MVIFTNANQWSRRAEDYAETATPQHVLLAKPSEFAVVEAQNPLMADEHGHLHQVDKELAQKQWHAVSQTFTDAGLICMALDAVPGLVDFCFTANPSFVMPATKDVREVWLARMRYSSRQAEVDFHRAFFYAAGFLVRELPDSVKHFEGHGDGLWHPRRRLLHAAIGPRTEIAAWQGLQQAYPDLDILLYKLMPGAQYHLDTALAPLNEDTALAVRPAFSPVGWELLQSAFPHVIALSAEQGAKLLGNAFCADGHTVFLPSGDPALASQLDALGFSVKTLHLSEFHKAGGSVFCLKQAY